MRRKTKVLVVLLVIVGLSIIVPNILLVTDIHSPNSTETPLPSPPSPTQQPISISHNNNKHEPANLTLSSFDPPPSSLELKTRKVILKMMNDEDTPDNATLFYSLLHKTRPLSMTFDIKDLNNTSHGSSEGEVLLWGQTSVGCARKSMLFNFASELHLKEENISYYSVVANSLCEDEAFFKYPISLQLLSLLGLYPAPILLVDMRLETKDHSEYPLGVYLFMYLPLETIQRYMDPNVSFMVQRANYGGKWVGPKWVNSNNNDSNSKGFTWTKPGVNSAPILSSYYQLFTNSLEEDQIERVKERMDLDRYLAWLAFNSFLQNGDFQDEIFFFTSSIEETFFSFVPWDYSEIQSRCHRNMCGEFRDPLLHCAESSLDRFVIYNENVRNLYREYLNRMIGTPDHPGVLSDLIVNHLADSLQYHILSILQNQLLDHPQPLFTEPSLKMTGMEVMSNVEELIGSFKENVQYRRRFLQGVVKVEKEGLYYDQNMEVRAPLHVVTGMAFAIDLLVTTGDFVSFLAHIELNINPAYSSTPPSTLYYTANVYRGRGSISIILPDSIPPTPPILGASLHIRVQSEDGEWRGYKVSYLNDMTQRWSQWIKPDQIATRLLWGPYDDVYLDGQYEIVNKEFIISRGTNVYMRDETVLRIANSSFIIDAPSNDPVTFTILLPNSSIIKLPFMNNNTREDRAMGSDEASYLIRQSSSPSGKGWGEIKLVADSKAMVKNAYFIGGGANPRNKTYNLGHSDSRPVIHVDKSHWQQDGGGVVDNIGKGFGSTDGMVSLFNVLISRCDTGGEMIRTITSYDHCHVLEIPDAKQQQRDDDNDGIYVVGLYPNQTIPSSFRSCVFACGEDDAIDQNGSLIEVEDCWIERFYHEGIASSNGGSIHVSDTIITQCEQGAEAGYGSAKLTVDHCLIFNNSIGIRYGDGYDWSYNGSLIVKNSISMGNGRNWRNWVFKKKFNGGRPADPSLVSVDDCSIISPDDPLLGYDEYSITALPGSLWNSPYSFSSVSLHWNLSFDAYRGSILLHQHLFSPHLRHIASSCSPDPSPDPSDGDGGGGIAYGPRKWKGKGDRVGNGDRVEYRVIEGSDESVAQCLVQSLNFAESAKNITEEKLLFIRRISATPHSLSPSRGSSNGLILNGSFPSSPSDEGYRNDEGYRIDWKPYGSDNGTHRSALFWDQGWGEIVAWHYIRSFREDIHHPASLIATPFFIDHCSYDTENKNNNNESNGICRQMRFLRYLYGQQKGGGYVGAGSSYEPFVLDGATTLGKQVPNPEAANSNLVVTRRDLFIQAQKYLTRPPGSPDDAFLSPSQLRAYIEIFNQEIFDYLLGNYDRWKDINWFSVCTPDAFAKEVSSKSGEGEGEGGKGDGKGSLLTPGCSAAYFDNGLAFDFWYANGTAKSFSVPSNFGCKFDFKLMSLLDRSFDLPSPFYSVIRSLACDPLHHRMATYVNFYDLHHIVFDRLIKLDQHVEKCMADRILLL